MKGLTNTPKAPREKRTDSPLVGAYQFVASEQDDIADFLTWCETWDKWFHRTVRTVKLGDKPPVEPAWYGVVYGGQTNHR